MKKNILIIVLSIIFILIAIFLIFFKTNYKLKKIGYKKEEIQEINKLTKNSQNLLSNHYLKNIKQLINNNNFKENYLKNYINYKNTYSNADINSTIILVNYSPNKFIEFNKTLENITNSKEFDIKNLKKYIEYFNKNKDLSSETIIIIINNDLSNYTDKIDEKKLIALVNEKYFKKDNLERYINYIIKNTTLEPSKIISNVNSNIDYNFYTNTKDTDMSKEILIIVNKFYKLKSDYEPSDLTEISSIYGKSGYLRKEAYTQFIKMYDNAKKDNLGIYISSPYRSYNTQLSLYQSYVNRDGVNSADTYSARPGYSEHQTGLAVDVTSKTTNLGTFESTKEFKWMIENSYKYGFILRYPKGKEYITGYVYEPWHYRYVGIDTAKKIHDLDITYEEYYEYYLK